MMTTDFDDMFAGKIAEAMTKQEIIDLIEYAFSNVQYPGDRYLVNGPRGDLEIEQVENAFRGKSDWRLLDAKFLDNAPDHLGSALSFLSDAAYLFYLPAYMTQSLNHRFEKASVVFSLTYGLNAPENSKPINTRYYGKRTWWDKIRFRYSMFDQMQIKAILAYLQYKADDAAQDADQIKQSIQKVRLYFLP